MQFLLSVPPGQWYNDKGLLRIVMRGRLPNAIVDRPKVPLSVDPLDEQMRRYGSGWLRGEQLSPMMDRFVNRDAIPVQFGGTSTERFGGSSYTLIPLLLAKWMATA